jgi:hypothetical protein
MSSCVKKAIKDIILAQGTITLANIETGAFNEVFSKAAHSQGIYHSQNKERYNVLFGQVRSCIKRTLRDRERRQLKKEETSSLSPYFLSPAEWLADVSRHWRRADVAIALAGGSFD